MYGKKVKKKTGKNLTLITHDLEPCHLVLMWLMTSFGALSQCWHIYG